MSPRPRAPLVIPDAELEIRASRAGGPGGQHVNTSSTRVEVRWNVETSARLSPVERERLRTKLAGRIDGEGWLRIVAAETRSQARNREAAIRRLHALVEQALVVPKTRRPTRVPSAEKARRLVEKRRRSATKRERGRRDDD
jgi:ribosome-associated protein